MQTSAAKSPATFRRGFRSSLILAAALALPGVALAQSMPGKGVTVRPVEGSIIEEKFQHRIIYRALEELGYEVADPQEVEYQTMHLAVGAGDGDFSAVHWNPLHQAFYDESGGGDSLMRVGSLVEGALQGYLVDKASYDSGITNLGDLKDPAIAKRFDTDGDGKANMAGCVPGWGCERVIEHQLTEYGLRDTVNHDQGAYAAIIADTLARHQRGEPIVYYTWTPYWVSGVLVPGDNVEWLEVPYSSLPDNRTDNTMFQGKNLGFAVNSLQIVANADFLGKNPAAKKLFELMKIDINDVSGQNNKIRDGEDSDRDINRHVSEWIDANRAQFDAWVEAARAAG